MTRRRPPAAWKHDAMWKGPLGRTRVRQFWVDHPYACLRCADHRNNQVHHVHYYQGATGFELDGTFRALCIDCHRLVHRRHDRWFPLDRWPYQRLAFVTDFTIRTGRLWYGIWRQLPEWRTS